MASIATRLARRAISTYQRHISAEYNGVRGSQCAYHSSCSSYARETLEEEGLVGLTRVLARLRRCTPENHAERISQLLRYTANCPPGRLHELFHFDSEESREAFLGFRTRVLKGAAQLAAGDDESGVATVQGALTELFRSCHIRQLDPVGDPSERPGFHVGSRRAACSIVMADRGWLGNALREAAGVGTACLAGLIGGLGGAAVGMLVVGTEGLASGLGLRTSLEAWSNERLGPGSLSGTFAFRQKIDGIYEGARRVLGFESLANVVGGAAGLTAGIAVGLVTGLRVGGGIAWNMGRILGRNLSDPALAYTFASRGPVEIAPASQPKLTPEPDKSTPAQQAQQLWNVLTDTPQSLRDRSRPDTAPRWQFALFCDATADDLESAEIRRVVEFERNLPLGATARIQLRRGGVIPAHLQRVLPWARLAGAAAGLAAAGGISGASMVPVLLARIASLGLGASAAKEMVRDALTQREPDWTGRRVYAVQQALPGRARHIQSHPIVEDGSVLPDGPAQLAANLLEAFSREGPRVAIFSGHGRSYQSLAGHDPQVLGAAMAEVARRSGSKIDLLVLEACYTGTLEGLRPLAAGARYALVSQLPVLKVGLPWHHILKHIDELGQDPRALACGIVELTRGRETVPSLSVIDLEKVDQLSRELERLAQMGSLGGAVSAGDLSRPESWAQRLLQQMSHLMPGSHSGDLARILKQLESQAQDPAVLAQVRIVRDCLERTVVSAQGQDLGGLSVETPSPFFDQESYTAATGMPAWGARLAEDQPSALKPLGRWAHRADQQLERARNSWLEWLHRGFQ